LVLENGQIRNQLINSRGGRSGPFQSLLPEPDIQTDAESEFHRLPHPGKAGKSKNATQVE